MEFSLACTLSEPELRERRRLVLEPIRAAAVRLTPLPAGLACSFNASSEMLIKLAQLVDLERQSLPIPQLPNRRRGRRTGASPGSDRAARSPIDHRGLLWPADPRRKINLPSFEHKSPISRFCYHSCRGTGFFPVLLMHSPRRGNFRGRRACARQERIFSPGSKPDCARHQPQSQLPGARRCVPRANELRAGPSKTRPESGDRRNHVDSFRERPRLPFDRGFQTRRRTDRRNGAVPSGTRSGARATRAHDGKEADLGTERPHPRSGSVGRTDAGARHLRRDPLRTPRRRMDRRRRKRRSDRPLS